MALGDRFRSWFRFRTADIAPAIFIFIVLLAGILLVSFSKPRSTSPQKEAIRSSKGDSVKETIDTIRLLSQPQKGIDSRTRETSKDYVGPPSHSDYQPKEDSPKGQLSTSIYPTVPRLLLYLESGLHLPDASFLFAIDLEDTIPFSSCKKFMV